MPIAYYEILLCILLLFLAYEILLCIRRKYRRRKQYKLAQERAHQLQKPLLVIGDPGNGLASRVTGADYGYGDVCLDLTGCPGSPTRQHNLKGRAEEQLLLLDTNSHIVFESCTLEYVDDPLQVTREMFRVAGGDPNNIFGVRVDEWSLEAYFYPGAWIGDQESRRIVRQSPTSLEWHELS
jgi:hypothetical protein